MENIKGYYRKKNKVVTIIDQLLIEVSNWRQRSKTKQHIADKSNEYFTNIGPQLAEEIPFVQGSLNRYIKGVYRNSMFLLPAKPDEIRGIINNLTNSRPGWDGITPFILKQAFSNLLDPLLVQSFCGSTSNKLQ